MTQAVTRCFNEYIFLSDETTGRDGRRVFINPDLLAPYLEFVEEYSFAGQQSLQKMIALKNSAAGLTSQSNQNNAHQHRLDCGSVVVTYSVLQAGTPNSFGDGVYISGLQQSLNRGQGDPAGFYKVSGRRTGWTAQPETEKVLTTAIGVVAAAFDGKNNTYDLKVSGKNTGEYLEKKAKGSDLGNGFSLYYSPTFIIDGVGTWRTPEQKVVSENAGHEELARILINTQNRYWGDSDQVHHWYIFGHGAKLLEKALGAVEQSGTNELSHHKFNFVEPRASLGSILPRIERLGASFDKLLSLNSAGARYFQAASLEATRAGLQSHDKSWSAMDRNLTPASQLLAKVDRVVADIAKDPASISGFSHLTFVGLVNKLNGTLSWGS